MFILTHYNYLDTDGKKDFDYINNKFNWTYISANLNSIKFLITKLEKDCLSIADIYLNLIFCFKQLIQISYLYPRSDENNLSKDLYNALYNRFTTTVQMHLPILAFFLTGLGPKSLLFNDISGDVIPQTKEILKNYLKNNNYPEIENLLTFYDKIIQNYQNTFLFNCNTTLDSVNFWRNILKGELFWIDCETLSEEEKAIQMSFAKVALEILSIPCSECACERCFSHLGDILMNNKRNMSFEMLNALMKIRMNSIFLKQNGIESNHFISNDLQRILKNDDETNNRKEFQHDPLVFLI